MIKEIINTARSQDFLFRQITYTYHFSGLKTATEEHNITIVIDVSFDQYNVLIQSSNESRKYPYSKKITEEEKSTIITPLLKEVINHIKGA